MSTPPANTTCNPPSRDVQPVTDVQGLLSKSVTALAIEPLSMALTLNGRRAYNVMLWIAQRSQPDQDGGYTSAIGAIISGFGGSVPHADRVQRYIEQMVQTTVIWRPLDSGAPQVCARQEPDDKTKDDTQEVRTFALLSEARMYLQNGQAWVTWYYPPSIREQLISPDRWAQIELQSLARLSTYTSVALYEICARYKDSPGGVTSRHAPDFWVAVLREGGDVKAREYRKFKHELLRTAIQEINECTEIDVEIVEYKRGRTVESIQFRVARKRNRPEPPGEAVDVTLAVRADASGVRESDLDALIAKHGEPAVERALQAMEAQIQQPKAAPVMNRTAYLRKIVLNQDAAAAGREPQEARQAPASSRTTPYPVKTWMESRLKVLAQEFSGLDASERDDFIEEYLQERRIGGRLIPAMIKRLENREWESPLVRHGLLTAYAVQRHGPQWNEPEVSG